MLDRLIRYLERKLHEMQTHKRRADRDLPAEPEGKGVVMRFQGRYDCGHPWPLDKLAPEICPEHGEGCNRVYRADGEVDFSGVRVSPR